MEKRKGKGKGHEKENEKSKVKKRIRTEKGEDNGKRGNKEKLIAIGKELWRKGKE